MIEINHYNQNYFDWQKRIGEFGGWANRSKFIKFINPNDVVLDFGCGGGYLLRNLNCKTKLGVDINRVARQEAAQNGVVVYETLDAIPNESVNVIISNHALEHCPDPLEILRKLREKLKSNGAIIFVTVCESIGKGYDSADKDQHLYSWSPQCLGNLFAKAGFSVQEVRPYVHKWPPGYRWIARIGGRFFFDLCACIWAHLERTWFQVRIIAVKEDKRI